MARYEASEQTHLSLLEASRQQKLSLLEQSRAHRAITPAAATTTCGFWTRIARLAGDLEGKATVERLLSELARDTDSVRAVVSHLQLRRGAPETELQLELARQTMHTLRAAGAALKVRHRKLAEQAFLRYLFFNPAFPRTVPQALRDEADEAQEPGLGERVVDQVRPPPKPKQAAPRRMIRPQQRNK